ncbi:RING-H2 finger protein ATL5-like [Selaginella moellendorffii]|uniref:RING-H2 finger protein ATL5-like n=1 Tax=Selaginella moellendorffii TaxID=88036 RepID=UPI000D1C577B|nr:RING-H2 finger protein ATL5-like [Selaginella moellendorffii]XP_024529338.1 RING-H2 finger protein ATL5-like [Selaginella moellendorffii]|eukprot:XP_024529334.1 RING-H2 finger protein ATL5-like [Selaginella moellendorffii]
MGVESPMDPSGSSSSAIASSSDSNPYQVNIKIMIAAIVVLFSVILFILSLHLYAKWFWKSSQFAARRRRLLHLQQIQAIQQQIQAAAAADPLFFSNSPALGVDKSIIQSLPLFVFRESDKIKLDCCAVCLCEFQEGDHGRTLPKCGHSFHTECIDMWLHCHSTCPLCRASLLSSSNSAGCPKSIVPELLLLPDLNLVATTTSPPTSSSTDLVPSSSSSTPSPSSSSSSSSSSSTSGDSDSQHQPQQSVQVVQLVLDLDENATSKSLSSSPSTSSSAGGSLSAKRRWRNLRRMLGRLSPSSPLLALPPSASCSFSSTSSAASYAVSVVGESSDLQGSYNSILVLVE